jgi:ankyrin repeat protein
LSSSNQLTNAVTSGDESAVKALLTDGADVNERTSGGQTALILAVIFGHTHLVHLLVNFGADPQLRDNLGLNAIDWAKRRGLTEVLDVLENAPHQPARETKIVVNLEEPEKDPTEAQPKLETDSREILSEDEKSRRWLAGLKQRLRE